MQKKIALVTGSNRGIGFEVCRQLCKLGVIPILTSRSAESGLAALEKLKGENLSADFHPLDVTQSESIDELFDWIKNKFKRLDILVNNAGIFIDSGPASILSTSLETIQKTLETNTFAPLRIIQKAVPLMKAQNYGRIVNLSSGMGQLSEMNGGSPGYRISKTALNAVTRIAADELGDVNILVNSVCPGWVKTDMGGSGAELSVEEGADTVVWAATLPDDGARGGFFRERSRIEW